MYCLIKVSPNSLKSISPVPLNGHRRSDLNMVFRLERERETKVRGGEGRELRNILFSNGDINWALGPTQTHTLYFSADTTKNT